MRLVLGVSCTPFGSHGRGGGVGVGCGRPSIMCLFSRADRRDHVGLCLRGIRSLLDLNGRLIGRKRRDLSRKMDVGKDVDGIAAAKQDIGYSRTASGRHCPDERIGTDGRGHVIMFREQE
jgi:hypothetical protein